MSFQNERMATTDEEGDAQRIQAKVLESQFRFAFFRLFSFWLLLLVLVQLAFHVHWKWLLKMYNYFIGTKNEYHSLDLRDYRLKSKAMNYSKQYFFLPLASTALDAIKKKKLYKTAENESWRKKNQHTDRMSEKEWKREGEKSHLHWLIRPVVATTIFISFILWL